MVEEGYGPPPVDYCWITMGSSGRKEQYARTDQDNGIIYGDVPEDEAEEVKNYFLILGEKVVAGMEQYGFERCKGKVMANNEKWCRSFRSWRHNIKGWIDNLLPENIRLMTIFRFSLRMVKKSLPFIAQLVVRNFRDSTRARNSYWSNLDSAVAINIFRLQTERSGKYRHQLI